MGSCADAALLSVPICTDRPLAPTGWGLHTLRRLSATLTTQKHTRHTKLISEIQRKKKKKKKETVFRHTMNS